MNTTPVVATFIASVATLGTGGNCMADVFLLKSGKAIVIADEALAIYDNPNDFLNEDGKGEVENGRDMPDVGAFERGASRLGLTFADRIELYEPDGPVSVDLLVLCDGRVLGIDTDSAVLYPSMAYFEDGDNFFNETDERAPAAAASLPTLDLDGAA